MSNALVGYMREGKVHDLRQGLFPGKDWKTVQEEWHKIEVEGGPEMVRILFDHIRRLPVPSPGEAAIAPLFPIDYNIAVASIIDRILPDWNAPQKAVVWITFMKELYYAAGEAWDRRCKGDPLITTPSQHIADDILAQAFKNKE